MYDLSVQGRSLTRSVQRQSVRNKTYTTAPLPLQQPMGIKMQVAAGHTLSSLPHLLNTKTPAKIMPRVFTPTSVFHQNLRSNKIASTIPLLASANTPPMQMSQ